jgi:hypothetical protein
MLLSQLGVPLKGLEDVDEDAFKDFSILHLLPSERHYLETHGLDPRGLEIIHESQTRAAGDANWYSYRETVRLIAIWERQVRTPTRLTVAQVQRLRHYLSGYRPVGFADDCVVRYIQEKLGEGR